MKDERHVDPYPNRPFTGQLGGLASGTAGSFPAVDGVRAILTAHPSNLGTAWIGFQSGTVTPTTGYPLSPFGGAIALDGLDNLGMLRAVFDVGNDRVCWVMQRVVL